MDIPDSTEQMQQIQGVIAAAIESGILNGPSNAPISMVIQSQLGDPSVNPVESLAIHVAIQISQAEADASEPAPTVEPSVLEHDCPVMHYRRSMLDTHCNICLSEFKPNRRVRRLPCGHLFCAVCVTKWLVNESVTCPTCRRDVRM